MDFGDTEFFKLRNWVQTFMEIPFGIYRELGVSADNKGGCNQFMSEAYQTLNTAVYGLDDAKIQIMQMLGQLIVNPLCVGSAIAIQGPPGTGKTSLVKEGISKILGRPFNFIALGGATDSSFLDGHSYTYEGSTWGKIVQILLASKCMNPVIYFDELDKISDTAKGEEIVGILTHLTDTSQNSEFHDKYFSELEFDLSKCLFIFSYNDETRINPILKDRMYRIHTKGYDVKQKVVIAKNYLLPAIRDQIKFTESEVMIPDDVLVYIIDNFCMKEEGVRNLKRCLEIVFTKLNLFRLMDTNSELLTHRDFKGLVIMVDSNNATSSSTSSSTSCSTSCSSSTSTSTIVLTKTMVDLLIKRREEDNISYKAMYL
jgi:ATP-dependent Lon protease